MNLSERFRSVFGNPPVLIAEAPGRVNLIGEHTDYNGCPVLPMAIQYGISAAAAPVDRQSPAVLTFANTKDGYGRREFALEKEVPPFTRGDWGNYVKAGVQAVIGYFLQKGKKIDDFTGGKLLFHGTIPEAAGLSSSSALVVASAAAFCALNSLEIEPEIFAGVLAEGEQYVGTRGGGMDQAAALFGREGHAVKIDFHPFGVETVPLPGGYTFLTAHSLVEAPKTREAMDRYNRRVIECRLGTEVLDRAYRKRYGGGEKAIQLLGDVSAGHLGLSPEELERFVHTALHPEPYRIAELAAGFDLPEQEILNRYCRRRDGTEMPEPEEGYKIYQRVYHVLSEWKRVEDSVRVMREADGDGSGEKMEHFGLLMNGSHASCRDLYEISCPELDRLTAVLSAGGAAGARLTGAGFGGCAVALVPDARLGNCIEYVKREYYREYLEDGEHTEESVLFPCKPSSGARIQRLTGR